VFPHDSARTKRSTHIEEMNIIIMVWMKVQLMDEYLCKSAIGLEIITRWGNEMNGDNGGDAVMVMEMMPNPLRIFVVLRI
jgi:hypothetical protein